LNAARWQTSQDGATAAGHTNADEKDRMKEASPWPTNANDPTTQRQFNGR
jgi:hypothetical protein